MTKLINFLKKVKIIWLSIVNAFKNSDKLFFRYLRGPLKTKKFTVTSFLVIALSGVIFVFVFSLANGGYFHYNTDDILQNYPLMDSMIDRLKSGNLHLFDTEMLIGNSVFADAFYTPLDIFTFIILIMSTFMNTETAYSLVNLLKPVLGALILMKIMFGKNYKNKTVFIGALIFMYGGMSEAYMVWPTFTSLCFYAPLTMLFVEMYLKDKKKWWIIPVFAFSLVLYNFYFAYMLFAFFMIYMVIILFVDGKTDLYGAKGFYRNGEFWFYIISGISLLLLGLGMGMIMFLPSVLYQINETAYKSTDTFSFWKFPRTGHYFTIFIDMFFPNDPHNLMLSQSGDYVREHISLYMTTFGFIFLIYFFTKKGKQNRKLQFFILLFNVLALFPITSMILSAHSNAYVRWFFILYMINWLGMMKGLDSDSGKLKTNKLGLVLIEFVLLLGTASFILVLFGKINLSYWGTSEAEFNHQKWVGHLVDFGENYTDLIPAYNLSIHLKPGSELYWPMMIIGICVTLVFAAQLFLNKFKKLSNIMYFLLALELIGAAVALYSYIPVVNEYYYDDKGYLDYVSTTLEEQTDYDNSGVYRVVFDDTSTKARSNASKIEPNFNQSAFFHSFYDASINDFYKEVMNNTQSWSKRENGIYNPLGNYLFNNKYAIINKNHDSNSPYNQDIYMNENLYEKVYESTSMYNNKLFEYYEVKDMPDVTIYDSYYTPTYSNSRFNGTTTISSMANILNQAYFSYEVENTEEETGLSSFFSTDKSNDIATTYSSNQTDLFKEYNLFEGETENFGIYSSTMTNVEKDASFENSTHKYNVYSFSYNETTMESLLSTRSNMFFYISGKTRQAGWEELFVVDTEGNVHNMMYSNLSRETDATWIPDKLYVKIIDDQKPTVKVSMYSDDIINDYVSKQKTYESSMTLDNSTLNIKAKLPVRSEGYVIKTPYTYSTDWVVDNATDIKTINVDGGFLGLLVKGDEEILDVSVSYVPAGYQLGSIITVISFAAFGCMILLVIVVNKKDRRTPQDKQNDLETEKLLEMYT